MNIGEAQLLNNLTSSQGYKAFLLENPLDITISNLSTTSYIYVDFIDLTIKQQVGEPTLEDQVTKLLLGRVIAIGGNIIQVANDKVYSQQLPLFIAAIARRIGKGRDSGLQLSIDSVSGIALSSGIFFDLSNASKTNFGFLDFASQSPGSWFYTSETNIESSKVSVFNKTQYLDNNVLVNANQGRWLSSLIYLFNSENLVIAYPQSQHQSKSQAIESAYDVTLPSLMNEGALIGYIVYKEGEDFTDPNFAEIFNVDKQSSNTSASIGSGYLEIANSFNEFTEAQRLQAIFNLSIKEEQITGTPIQLDETDAETGNILLLDLSTFVDAVIDCDTVALTLDDTLGRPTADSSFTRTIQLNPTTNDGSYSIPADWEQIGAPIDATKTNFIVINYRFLNGVVNIKYDNNNGSPVNTGDNSNKDSIGVFLSALGADLTTGATATIEAPYDFTLVSAFIAVTDAPTGGNVVVDFIKNGTSITSTNASIEANEFNSLTGIPPVFTTTSFVKGDRITHNIIQVGSLNTGRELKSYLEIIKT